MAETSERSSGKHEVAAPQRRSLGGGGSKFLEAEAQAAAPAGPAEPRITAAVESLGPGAPPPCPRVAVLVVHGMGQQIRFQTLDQVEQGLRREEQRLTGQAANAQPASRARVVMFGDQVLERLEMTLTDPTDLRRKRKTEVHLYEAYWAPLTEGKVGIADVLSFLWRGGRNGIRVSGVSFQRFIFGALQPFGVKPKTGRQLLFTLAVLGALLLLNAVVTLLWTTLFVRGGGHRWINTVLLADLSLTILALLVVAAALVLLVLTARRMLFFYLLLWAVLLAALAFLATLALHWRSWGTLWPAAWVAAVPPVAATALWAGLVGASLLVRRLLVQFVGDVAAYVSPHHLDRFCELRATIKQEAGKVAEAIYRATDGSRWEYDQVAIVGHSLGSVVAYDTLNALINLDLLTGRTIDVAKRTCLLLTFGSPLDKTAFVFATQSRETTESREALATVCQPLVQDYALRTFPWVNVYSPKDIISGSLDFYDAVPPPAGAFAVENQVDEEADVPVYAHVQYWENERVFQRLQTAITRCGQPAAAAPAEAAAPPRESAD